MLVLYLRKISAVIHKAFKILFPFPTTLAAQGQIFFFHILEPKQHTESEMDIRMQLPSINPDIKATCNNEKE